MGRRQPIDPTKKFTQRHFLNESFSSRSNKTRRFPGESAMVRSTMSAMCQTPTSLPTIEPLALRVD
jgi:hypothetical protein